MASDPSTPVRSGGLVERAKAILLRPKEEWPRIAAESSTPTDVLIRYALPLAAIGPSSPRATPSSTPTIGCMPSALQAAAKAGAP